MPALAQTIHRWLIGSVPYNNCKKPEFRCSGICRCVNGLSDKEISKHCTAFILEGQQVIEVLRNLGLIDLSVCVCVCVCVYVYI